MRNWPGQSEGVPKFSFVNGLLLVRERFRIRHQTRMYIRHVDGDAISQLSMYAHSSSGVGRLQLYVIE